MHLLFQVLEWIIKAIMKDDADSVDGQWKPATPKQSAAPKPPEESYGPVPRGRTVVWTREGSQRAKLRRRSREFGRDRK